MSRQALRPGSGQALRRGPSTRLRRASGQAKSPSLAQDILILGDIYLALAWLAIKRLRHGPVWPWETRSGEHAASVVTLVRPREEAEESAETAPPKRG